MGCQLGAMQRDPSQNEGSGVCVRWQKVLVSAEKAKNGQRSTNFKLNSTLAEQSPGHPRPLSFRVLHIHMAVPTKDYLEQFFSI